MKLFDIIFDILKNSPKPLSQGEIWDNVQKHKGFTNCKELLKVKVPYSAVARCLSKFSGGSNPTFGFNSDGIDKKAKKKFYLTHENIFQNKEFKEADLHPYLVKFAKERFNVYSKTINALKSTKQKDKIGKWTNPDIVGINPEILNLSPLFQKEVEKLGMLSTKVIQFYSFELKLKIDKSNITECYFQAVSNSSWANFGYLVVGDLDINPIFLSNLTRLNNGYGIGVIKLNTDNPAKSEIIVSAREREIVDLHFMNFLSEMNKDFYNFVETTGQIIEKKKIEIKNFDAIINT